MIMMKHKWLVRWKKLMKKDMLQWWVKGVELGVWDLQVHNVGCVFELLGFRDFSFRLTLINLLGRERRHMIVARSDAIFCEM